MERLYLSIWNTPPPLKGTQACCVMSKCRTEFCIFELLLIRSNALVDFTAFLFPLPWDFYYWLFLKRHPISKSRHLDWRPSSFDWFVTSDWHIGQGEKGDSFVSGWLVCLLGVWWYWLQFFEALRHLEEKLRIQQRSSLLFVKAASTIHLTLWLGSSAHRQKQQ